MLSRQIKILASAGTLSLSLLTATPSTAASTSTGSSALLQVGVLFKPIAVFDALRTLLAESGGGFQISTGFRSAGKVAGGNGLRPASRARAKPSPLGVKVRHGFSHRRAGFAFKIGKNRR